MKIEAKIIETEKLKNNPNTVKDMETKMEKLEEEAASAQEKEIIAEQERDETVDIEKDKKIGIKIPYFIGYPLLILLVVLSIIVCYKAIVPKEEFIKPEVEILALQQVIDVGETIQIVINNQDENTIICTDNNDVVSIENNNITGLAQGKANIYAITDNKKSNEIEISVIVKAKSIKISEENIEIIIGNEKELQAKIYPENATYNDILWKSSDETVATVENGLIKTIKVGSAVITAYNLENNIESSCTVNVKEIEVKSISLDETSVSLGIGQSYILLATISPSNATNRDITWTSSNNNVITVQNGKIKAVGIGSAKVSVTSKNGKKATCTFNVSNIAPDNPIRYVTSFFNVRMGPRNKL